MGEQAGEETTTDKPAPPKSHPEFWWTRSQRRVLIGFISLLLIYLVVQRFVHPRYVSDPQPDVPSRFGELADRIDPNDADVPTLAALPAIGPKRAADIVRYRDAYVASHPDMIAFAKPEDLLRIKGIGASMLASMKPFLIFPNERRPTGTSQPIMSDQPE